MLTAREAFLAMAAAWDQPVFLDGFGWRAKGCGRLLDGLCGLVWALLAGKVISRGTRDRMMLLARRHQPYATRGDIFWWGHTREDAAARADFCRRMAELCGDPVTADLGAGI